MARIARFMVPDCPHHVTPRGNRRGTTFFRDDGDRLYRALLAEAAAKARTEAEGAARMRAGH
jgi:putative transposase